MDSLMYFDYVRDVLKYLKRNIHCYRNEDVSDIENAAYSDDDGLSTGNDGQSYIQIMMITFIYVF